MINIYASRIKDVAKMGESIEESLLSPVYFVPNSIRSDDLLAFKDVDIQKLLDEFSSKVRFYVLNLSEVF